MEIKGQPFSDSQKMAKLTYSSFKTIFQEAKQYLVFTNKITLKI